LTRDQVRPRRSLVTVAPITSTIRGLSVEVAVGTADGLDHACVISLHNMMTISVADLGRQIGRLLPEQEDCPRRSNPRRLRPRLSGLHHIGTFVDADDLLRPL
jgi:mRNA interferase MazF